MARGSLEVHVLCCITESSLIYARPSGSPPPCGYGTALRRMPLPRHRSAARRPTAPPACRGRRCLQTMTPTLRPPRLAAPAWRAMCLTQRHLNHAKPRWWWNRVRRRLSRVRWLRHAIQRRQLYHERLTQPAARSMRAGAAAAAAAVRFSVRCAAFRFAGRIACSGCSCPRLLTHSVNAVGRLLRGEWWGAPGIEAALPDEAQETSEPVPEPVLQLPSSLANLPAWTVRSAPKRRSYASTALTRPLPRGAGAASGSRTRCRLCATTRRPFASHYFRRSLARSARHLFTQRERAAGCTSCTACCGGRSER